jgi:DNA-binding LytR/AlgR family response regulator
MKKIKCIIVDDEPLAIEGLELYIKEVDYLELVGTFNNALQLNTFLKENSIDLIFLDIEMPHLSGIDFLGTLKTVPPTILTTAYPEFALTAFDLNVFDYLLKPYRFERFVKAINKVWDYYSLLIPQDDVIKDYIFIKSDRKFVKIYFNDIEYISGLKDYVILFTKTGKIITSMNIKTIYNQLPHELFSRTSKSYIININYIKTVYTDTIQLHSKEIPLGKGYKEVFLSNYISDKIVQRKK